MSAGNYDLQIPQGADYALQIVVKENDTPRDLSGYFARAQMRQKIKDVSPSATFSCSLPNPSGGEILMELDNSTTKNLIATRYYYDLEIYTTDSGGNDDVVVRLLKGLAIVSPEVTR